MNEVKENIMEYLLGGKAEFTLAQDESGLSKPIQVCYRVVANDTHSCYFIYVRNGKEYKYQGYFCVKDKVVRKGKKLEDNEVDIAALKALAWVISHAERLPNLVHIYHNGRCSRCGRKLTDAESLRVGLGPSCRQRI